MPFFAGFARIAYVPTGQGLHDTPEPEHSPAFLPLSVQSWTSAGSDLSRQTPRIVRRPATKPKPEVARKQIADLPFLAKVVAGKVKMRRNIKSFLFGST